MRIKVPEQNWAAFLSDLGRRRIGWRSRVEKEPGPESDLSAPAFLRLDNISVAGSGSSIDLEIVLVGTDNERQHHSISNPVGIVYLAKQGRAGGIVEIEEIDGTKVRVYLEESDLNSMDYGQVLGGSPVAVI